MAERWIDERRRAGELTTATAKNYRSTLYGFADLAPADPARISRKTVLRWLDTRRHLAPTTRRVQSTTVRSFCAWLLKHGVLTKDPWDEIKPMKRVRVAHRALNAEQAHAVVAACVTARERCVVMLGLHTGLRRAELAALEVADVSLSARTVTVHQGKGGHSRIVPLPVEAAVAVAAYLAEVGAANGPLLRSSRVRGQGLKPDTVWKEFDRVARRAGVKVAAYDGVSTHAMRHTAASDVYLHSHDVMAVSEMLGHVSLDTTRIYVRSLDVEHLRDAVEGRRYAA
jgi:site-specific recombinase XerD